MKPVLWLVLGLALASVLAPPVATAAPTGVCGEGGGVWDTADTLCVRGDGICLWWSPYTVFVVCT